MRNRLTKKGMGVNDSPTTMDAPHANPPVEKYETGDPEAWAEGVNMDRPWEAENSAGREETGHPKMKSKASMNYVAAVKEAKELEEKAVHCLKMSQTILPNAPEDVIERQAVDFMTMSSKSVLSSLRRMREFEENISEARVAKIVDAVIEVMGEEVEEKEEEKKEAVKEEKEEEKKEAVKEEEEEEKKEAMKEEEKEEEEKVEEAGCKKNEEEKEASEDAKLAKIVEAVLEVMSEEEKEEKEEEKEEEKKEAVKEEKEEKEEEEEEKKEAMKEEKEEEEEKEEMVVEEKKEGALEVTFDDMGDVMASKEEAALLSQIFSANEETKEATEEKKEAKIKTLKNVTASKSESEIEKLSSLWK